MERAILVNLATRPRVKEEAEESLAELEGLARAAGARVVSKVFQARPRPSPRSFIGSGKVEEVRLLREELRADLVIFDHNLSPVQQRSLEEGLGCKVIDRTQLILDIFSLRAHSNEGKLQVELAQLSYLLPRLVGKGLSLSRLGGGIGTRGPGEKKLEEDRRRILDRITRIKKEIRSLQKRRENQRKSRKESPIPTVSLVGYTSAGKSTLFNALSKEKTFTSPQLFATLDPLLRRVTYPDGLSFILSDTVGFIRKIPVELITSFQATLEEVRESDGICHIIDITSPSSDDQAEAVEKILEDIGAGDIPLIRVYNKIDLLPDAPTLLSQNRNPEDPRVFLSAKTGTGIPDLRDKLRALLFRDMRLFTLIIPPDRRDLLHSLVRRGAVLRSSDNTDHMEVQVVAKPELLRDVLPYIQRGESKC